MRRAPLHGLLPLLALLGASACGGDAAGPGNDDGPMTATIEGRSWASNSIGTTATVVTPGVLSLAGYRVEGLSSSAIVITLYNVRGTGTYRLGMGPTTVGGMVVYTEDGKGWNSPLSGAAGSVTLTALANGRAAGTFTFEVEPVTGGAAGTRQATSGRFDMPLNGTLTAPADNAGHRFSATVAGSPWNASTVVTGTVLANTFIASTSNTHYSVAFSISGFAGAGDYPIAFNASPSRIITVQRLATHPQGAACCWGGPGSTGTFTVSSMTAARVIGTFSASLAPQGAGVTGTLNIANGSFDVGR